MALAQSKPKAILAVVINLVIIGFLVKTFILNPKPQNGAPALPKGDGAASTQTPGATSAPTSGAATTPAAAKPPTVSKAPTDASTPSKIDSSKIDTSAIRAGLFSAMNPPPSKPAGAVRIAFYNVENLFDNRADGNSKASDEKPKPHKEGLALAIHAVNPDILALSEIESLDALKEFRDQYLADLGYVHVASIDAGDGRGIEQSVLSRFPISGVKNWVGSPLEGVHQIDNAESRIKMGDPLKLHRSPLRAVVTIPASASGTGADVPLVVYVMHHKAGREFDYWREAEAKFVISKVKEDLKPNALVALMGDFNSFARDAAGRLYTAGGMSDCFADRTRDATWATHESGRPIDHIFASAALAKAVVPNTRIIYGTPVRPPRSDWNTTPAPKGYASDHFPISIDVKLN
ncbi:MAG: endonuclease/exonuclease/phosphatase family protein [Planctomycetes bacterium]|nr:endonuclease/exonuclease/phosphatase family protein [Planctomycetota bacterium]